MYYIINLLSVDDRQVDGFLEVAIFFSGKNYAAFVECHRIDIVYSTILLSCFVKKKSVLKKLIRKSALW